MKKTKLAIKNATPYKGVAAKTKRQRPKAAITGGPVRVVGKGVLGRGRL